MMEVIYGCIIDVDEIELSGPLGDYCCVCEFGVHADGGGGVGGDRHKRSQVTDIPSLHQRIQYVSCWSTHEMSPRSRGKEDL